jgi:radical SAM superfamily enzyme YgiQ (UPF0313 family)
MVYPHTPETFWSFKNAVRFISKKSSEIPLGLITVAGLLPADWEIRLIDLNITNLKDRDIKWADFVFLSGMNIHLDSFRKVVRRCNELNVKVVAGGSMVTMEHEQVLCVDHFILNEAEITLPLLLKDLAEGHPQPIYQTAEFRISPWRPYRAGICSIRANMPQWTFSIRAAARLTVNFAASVP